MEPTACGAGFAVARCVCSLNTAAGGCASATRDSASLPARKAYRRRCSGTRKKGCSAQGVEQVLAPPSPNVNVIDY
eukprot:180137-Pelagomonas_calceolata.AAC.4